jgi:tetratricopeptide (TPR) repeat protein
MLSHIVYDFEAAHRKGDVPRLQDYLPSEPAERTTLLSELVRVDLEYRRKRGLPIRVDAYLGPFPDLSRDENLLIELIEAEYRQQSEQGARPLLDQYAQRFPEVAQRLFGTLGQNASVTGLVPEPAPVTVLPTVPGYEVLALLGEGGMGVVYLARHQALDRLVALKMLKVGAQIHAADLQRFRTEAEAVARLQHPHIVQIHAVGECNGLPYFTLEYCAGGSLAKKLGGTPLPVREAAQLATTLAEAIAAAHRRQIVHRDLKPHNVLLTEEGVPKIGDFGLAKKLDAPAQQTHSGAVIGTPSYMAPEQARGERNAAGPLADVYALGAILYELLTGRPPFKAATAWETVCQVVEEEPVPVRRLQPGVPRDLETICLKCLHKDPAKRYAGAAELADDLRRFQEGEPIVARPASLPERTMKWVKRRPALAGLVVALVLLVLWLAAGLAGMTWALVRADRAERLAREDEARAAAAERQAQTDKRRAEEEAANARAVNDFLNDLLGQADIANQSNRGGVKERDPNIGIRDLLGWAAKQIEWRLADQPLTEAALRLTIGTTYRALGHYAEAQPHLERSLGLRSARLGPKHPDTLISKNNLALLYHDQGKYDQAESLYQEALAAQNAARGPDDPNTLTYQNNLAKLYLDRGKLDQAEPLLKAVLDARLRHAQLGPNHPFTVLGQNNLAEVYRQQKKYDQAEPLLKAALVACARSAQLGPDHPYSQMSKINLALVYHDQGQYDRAEPLYREVLDAPTATKEPDRPDILTCKNNLGMLYLDRGQHEEAEPLLQAVLDARRAKLPPDHPLTLLSEHHLAKAYQAAGKRDQALSLFRQAAEGVEKRKFQHGQTGRIITDLSACYEELRQFAEAESWRRKWLAVVKERDGATSPAYAAELLPLGLNLLLQQKTKEAEAVLQSCLALRREKEPEAWTTFETQSLLGTVLLVQKRYAEAEPLLLQGYEGMKQRETTIPSGIRQLRLMQALERLVRLYELTGQKDRADAWRQKLGTGSSEPRRDEPPG